MEGCQDLRECKVAGVLAERDEEGHVGDLSFLVATLEYESDNEGKVLALRQKKCILKKLENMLSQAFFSTVVKPKCGVVCSTL